MLKSLLESINREAVTESDEDLMADNMDTSIRDAYLDEDGDLLPNDVTEAKIKDLIENLPETDSNGISKDEIRELSESYTDIFDEHDYVFEGAVEVPDKLSDLKKKVKELEKKDKLSVADKAKLAKYQAQIKVLTKVAEKKGVKEASSDLYADDEEIVDQYKGSAKNERTTPELYADKEEIIDQGTYEDTEIDLTEGSELYADDEEINDQYKSSFNNTRTSKDLYADDEEIKDVGVYEEDELDLTDLDDGIEGSCKEKCGSTNEASFHPSAKDDKMLKLKGEVIALEDKIADGKRKGMSEDELKKYHDELSDKKYELNTMVIDSHVGGRRVAMAGSDTDLSESSDMYADDQEINDQYKSSPNIQRTGNNNYADNQEIKDVGVYEDDDLDLTDLDDDIECGNNCGSTMEVKGDAEANAEKREYYEKRTGEHSINAKYAGNMDYSKSDETNKKPMTTAQDYHDRAAAAQRTKKYYGGLNEDVDLDLTAEEAFELDLLEANLYADDEPVEDKYKTSPSGKIEHEDYYADNQEIKDVGVYESDDNGETPEVDEADPGENLAEESLLIDLLDI